VSHFTLGEGFDEAFHTVQATPFCFAVSLLDPNLGTVGFEGFDFGPVASSVSLASILCAYRMLARARIHLPLVSVAFAFLLPVRTTLLVAFTHLSVVPPNSNVASILRSKILVQEAVPQATTPAASPGVLSAVAVDMTATKCTSNSLDEVRGRLASCLGNNLTITVRIAHDATLCPVVGAPHPLDAKETTLLAQAPRH
jgi:hypothetical protein